MEIIHRLAAMAVLIWTSVAAADPVFVEAAGDWSLKGYVDAENPDRSACILSTIQRDGTRIQVNVFPRIDNSANVTMTLFSEYRDVSSFLSGTPQVVRVDFKSAKYGDFRTHGTIHPIPGKRAIFKNLNNTFILRFTTSDMLVLFSETPGEIVVMLNGTSRLGNLMKTCSSAVLLNE